MNSKVISVGDLPGKHKFHIRYMEIWDVPEVLEVWKEIGLYEGTHTIESFIKIDPKGFLVAVSDQDGSIIGTMAGVFVDPKTAFIGLYAVRPIYQGLGIGMKLWKTMLQHVQDMNAGLHAVPKHRKTYKEKAGFCLEDDIKILEYGSKKPKTDDLVKKIENIDVIVIEDKLCPRIANFDEKIVKHNRGKLLANIFQEEDSLSMAAIDRDNGSIVGYGCFRKNNIETTMAGPIYADNDGIAELIVYNLIENFVLTKERGLNMMIPDCSPGALRIAHKIGAIKHEELPRFFTKFIPKANFDKIYCITTPNFSPF